MNIPRAIIVLGISCIGFYVLILALNPQIYSYNKKARMNRQVRQMLNITKPAQVKVESILLANPGAVVSLVASELIPKTFDGYLANPKENIQITHSEISAKGVIKVFSPQLGTLFILTPAVSNGNVIWDCWGSSTLELPSQCRQPERDA